MEKHEQRPGLKWRIRQSGALVPYWIPSDRARALGYPIKTLSLADTPADELGVRCHRLQADMLEWLRVREENGVRFDGTLGAILQIYLTHLESPLRALDPSAALVREVYARLAMVEFGRTKLLKMIGLDLLRWQRKVSAPRWNGEPEQAHEGRLATSVIHGAVSFAHNLGIPDRSDLRSVLKDLSRRPVGWRAPIPHPESVCAARAAAHLAGRSSLALSLSLEFEAGWHRWETIGVWVPLADPRLSDVASVTEKWIGPTWASLTSAFSEGGRPDISDCPMIREDVARISVSRRKGPLLTSERTELPYRPSEFLEDWRALEIPQ